MSAFRNLAVGLLTLVVAAHASAQTPLEILPEDAVVALAIRDLDDLIKKGDVFIKDADIRTPARPSDLFDQGTQALGIRKGYDRKAAAAVLLMPPEKKEDTNSLRWLDNSLVGIIPFTDADEMADNFGVGKGQLMLKTVRKSGRENDFPKYLTRTQKQVLICGGDKALERIVKGKSVASALTPAHAKLFDRSDVLLHIGRWVWTQEADFRGDWERMLKGDHEEVDKAFLDQFVASVKEVQHTVFGFRLHEGLDGHMLVTVPKSGAAAKFLAGLRDKKKPSSLRGLPDGNVLHAQATSGDSKHHAMLARLFFNFLVDAVFINQRFIHQVDRYTYLGVFNEVFRHLQGHRLAVYQNADERKHGLFSTVAILDPDDAKLFVAGMRILAKMATADTLDLTKKEVKEEIDIDRLVRDLRSSVYAVRQSANTKLNLIGEPALPALTKALDSPEFDLESKRRARELRDRINAVAAQRRKDLLDEKNRPLFGRPKLTFIANIEKRENVGVDIINIKLDGPAKAAAPQLAQLLGPDWDKVRLAIVGNQIVVMLGSDTALFESAIRNLQKSDAGLAGSKRLAGFHEAANKERQFEFHVSIEGILRLVDAKAKLDTPSQMTSVSLTIGEQSLQMDARVPMPEVRTIAKKVQETFPQ